MQLGGVVITLQDVKRAVVLRVMEVVKGGYTIDEKSLIQGLKSFMLNDVDSCDFCGCYEGDVDRVYENGVLKVLEFVKKFIDEGTNMNDTKSKKYVIAYVNGDTLDTYKDDDGAIVFFDDRMFAEAYLEFELGSDTDYDVYLWG